MVAPSSSTGIVDASFSKSFRDAGERDASTATPSSSCTKTVSLGLRRFDLFAKSGLARRQNWRGSREC